MNKTVELLGDKAEHLLSHTCKTIDKSTLYLPSPHTVEEVWAASDRNIPTLNSLQRLLGHGRLGGTGYVSILPVDQGIEHTAGAFAGVGEQVFGLVAQQFDGLVHDFVRLK